MIGIPLFFVIVFIVMLALISMASNAAKNRRNDAPQRERLCTACGAANSPIARFCRRCGKQL